MKWEKTASVVGIRFFFYLFKLKFIWQMAHVSPSNLTRIEIFSNVLICQVRTVDGAIEI